MTGCIYFNPTDFNTFKSSSPKLKDVKDVLVDIKKFIIKALPLDDIPKGAIGASAFQRDMF